MKKERIIIVHQSNDDKRVACLYRVSTTKQLDDNDIPMQQNACRKFIAQHENWRLVNEYIEKGVSGFKVSVSDRDEIQNILRDASKGLFDILLLFFHFEQNE